jgi:hypothetical protein
VIGLGVHFLFFFPFFFVVPCHLNEVGRVALGGRMVGYKKRTAFEGLWSLFAFFFVEKKKGKENVVRKPRFSCSYVLLGDR